MTTELPVPTCTVDKKGRVVCPTCHTKIPVPDTHVLTVTPPGQLSRCPNGHGFIVDSKAVEAFHYFLGKAGSKHSKEMLKNLEPAPERRSDGGIILP